MSLSDILAAADLSGWAQAGLLVSFAAFVAVVFRVFLRSPAEMEAHSRLPMEDAAAATPSAGRGGSASPAIKAAQSLSNSCSGSERIGEGERTADR